MKHLLELLICGTVGTYCLIRFAAVLPAAIAEAQAVMAAYAARQQIMDEINESPLD